ncbi:MAG: sigma-70 family RNA polymerase sigma factor [Streptosporangiaceae bacterium]|jgi:RNA polymerase sigma factor (sigma-70 family)
MRDRDMVAAIVAGDPAGLAAAYDSYAAALHTYCRPLLGEPADAADAVQDTFVIASAKLGGLRDPDRLRPWLYAVARNECHRRLRSRAHFATLEEAGEVTDTAADASMAAQRSELKDLVLAAIGGLNPGEREIIELNLRHDLDGADLADALGVPPNQAHALASRARSQLERSLGALLVARRGREACAELDAMLAGWDGGLTILLRKRVSRHIEHCEICDERKRRELSPAMLLSVLPVVALPAGLRQQILRLVSDSSPAAARYRQAVLRRAEPFSPSGFPVQVSPGGGGRRAERARGRGAGGASGPGSPGGSGGWRRAVIYAAAAAVLLLGAGGVAAFVLLHHSGPATAAMRRAVTATAAATTAPGTASSAVSSSQAPGATRSLAASPSSTAPGTSAPPSSSPAASSSGPASSSPSAPPPSSPPPDPGTLSASPSTVRLAQSPLGGPWTGTFTLTASGGPVAFTITVPAADKLLVTPATGKLTAGQGVTVTVTTIGSGPPYYVNTLTVNPGSLTVTVYYPPSG